MSVFAIASVGCGSGIHDILSPILPPPAQAPPTPIQMGCIVISPQNAAAGPAQTFPFAATISGCPSGPIQWQVNGVVGGNATVGTVDATGNYTAPSTVPQSFNAVVTAALASSPAANFASATVAVIQLGNVTGTTNPQVASYAMYLPAPGKVAVRFGKEAAYGFDTSSQTTSSANGGQVVNLVAGMLGATTYHMRADVTLDNGATMSDIDQTFTTGAAPATTKSPVQATTGSGQTPQPGIQLFDTVVPHSQTAVFATDLQGNVLWTYTYTDGSVADLVYPVRLLPNGHFLVLISSASSAPVHTTLPPPPGTIAVVREVDLVGNTIREISLSSLNTALAASTNSSVKPLKLIAFHHDVLPLPNGHFIVIASLQIACASIPPLPSFSPCSGTDTVLGDALIDLDPSFTPVWTWSAFDHLDPNRRPMQFPDWTHSNAILYSTDDQNLLLSMRHQNLIIKIAYQNGQGDGHVIWHLGHQGDFKLVGGTAPTDWFYAQHGPNYFTPNTTGVFRLGILDNGNDRIFPPGVACDSAGAPPCHYSAAPLLQLDESAMTATLVTHYTPMPYDFDAFGGNVDMLANGDLEADFCGVKTGSVIQELNQAGGSSQLVWQATTPGTNQYRSFRLPSLYPGIQWP